jgi:hypothetical protein
MHPASSARRRTFRPHRVGRSDFLRDSGKRYAVIPDEVEQAVSEHAGLCIDMRTDEILISADEHAQTSVSNMATATPLGPPGPRRRRSSTPGCSSWTRNQGSASVPRVTHRYSRTHCLWLEQFQIADYGRLTTIPSCEDDAHRSADSGRLLSSNAFDRPSVGGRPDNGPLSRPSGLRHSYRSGEPDLAGCTALDWWRDKGAS